MTENLIIYFSRNGENYFKGELKNIEKGNTQVIAEYIKNECDADIFKVEEVNTYPYDYEECTAIARKEQKQNLRPEIKQTLTDISQYETIFIGFPNWWGTLPMPMWTQLEELDFTGKTIKPFVTHEGSGFGSSLNDLKKLCNGGKIKKGLSISGSEVYESETKVKLWVHE